MTLEDQIAAVKAAGLKINNLFQAAGRWQANLTNGTDFFEFGEGPTAAEALADAMQKSKIEIINLWD